MNLIPTVNNAQRMGLVRTGGPKTMKRTYRFLLPVKVENCRFLEVQKSFLDETWPVEQMKVADFIFGVGFVIWPL